jgi:drug/metabolite transporter (DMT)-like permease
LPGDAKALLSAALWAVAGIVFAFNMRRLGPVTLNLIRSLAALVFLGLLVAIVGTQGLGHMSAGAIVTLVGSAVLAIALGDTFFFASLPTLGASLAVPLSSAIYPVLTFIVAVLWLDESLTWMVGLGTALIIVGVFLLAWRAESTVRLPGEPPVQRVSERRAMLLLVIASVFYTGSTLWLRAGAETVDALPADLLRAAAASAFLLLALGARRTAEPQRPTSTAIISLIAAGIISIGIGGILYIQAVQEAGAGKTAVLTSTMPLFNLPLAVFFLRERVTPRIVAGTIISVLGIWLVV